MKKRRKVGVLFDKKEGVSDRKLSGLGSEVSDISGEIKE